MKTITRSSKIHLKHANKRSLGALMSFFDQDLQNRCVNFTNMLLYMDDIPKYIPSNLINQHLPKGRMGQLLAKECSSVARSMREKIKKCETLNDRKKYQQEIIEKFQDRSLTTESISSFNLDSRFVSIEASHSEHFDRWIKLSIPNVGKFYLPFFETRHMSKLIERGYKLKTNTLRVNKKGYIELVFEKLVSKNEGSQKIGIDVGRAKSFVASNGLTENTTKPILNSLKSMKHGSKNKSRAVRKLKQEIDEKVKQIDFSSLSHVYMERLTNMKRGKQWGNINHHWSYRYIQNRISLHCEEHDVHVQYVNPKYTSQTCSSCGVVEKSSRNGESFSCKSCGYEIDADLNASINILNRGTNSAISTKTKRCNKIIS